MIRTIRLELLKPLDEQWETIGPLLRLLAKATPKLMNAAMDARIAVSVAGSDAVKAAIAPQAKAKSGEGLAYQAVCRAVASLKEWGAKKGLPFAGLEVPGGMTSQIARLASQAYARRDQGRQTFASEVVIVRAAETSLGRDQKGTFITIKLRPKGATRFAVAWSWGVHRDTLDKLVSGELDHGDCRIKFDSDRRKWYALLSFELPTPKPALTDPGKMLAVHRGIRNALYLLCSDGASPARLVGGKYAAQRRSLKARMRDMKAVSNFERGQGAKGHGKARRFESYDGVDGKLGRATHTFCQQAAAFVAETATRLGCGVVAIEDYGGVAPSQDRNLRRVLDRFPLFDLKTAIAHRLERDGIAMIESPAEYISSTCPRCTNAGTKGHNFRTGIFHCSDCGYERPADFVAAYWMLTHAGADMTTWHARLRAFDEVSTQLTEERTMQ